MQPPHQTAPSLSPEPHRRVDAVLDDLLDLSDAEQLEKLRALSTEDPAVLAEVGSLLLAARASGGFLESPVFCRAEPASPAPFIGTRIGAWRITRLIGHGGMGEVYE